VGRDVGRPRRLRAWDEIGHGGGGVDLGRCSEGGGTGRGLAVAACFCGSEGAFYKGREGCRSRVAKFSGRPAMAAAILTGRVGERVAAASMDEPVVSMARS
jgi:hypothetical protein